MTKSWGLLGLWAKFHDSKVRCSPQFYSPDNPAVRISYVGLSSMAGAWVWKVVGNQRSEPSNKRTRWDLKAVQHPNTGRVELEDQVWAQDQDWWGSQSSKRVGHLLVCHFRSVSGSGPRF